MMAFLLCLPSLTRVVPFKHEGTLSLVDWSYLKGQTREQALSENKARMDVHATDEVKISACSYLVSLLHIKSI